MTSSETGMVSDAGAGGGTGSDRRGGAGEGESKERREGRRHGGKGGKGGSGASLLTWLVSYSERGCLCARSGPLRHAKNELTVEALGVPALDVLVAPR